MLISQLRFRTTWITMSWSWRPARCEVAAKPSGKPQSRHPHSTRSLNSWSGSTHLWTQNRPRLSSLIRCHRPVLHSRPSVTSKSFKWPRYQWEIQRKIWHSINRHAWQGACSALSLQPLSLISLVCRPWRHMVAGTTRHLEWAADNTWKNQCSSTNRLSQAVCYTRRLCHEARFLAKNAKLYCKQRKKMKIIININTIAKVFSTGLHPAYSQKHRMSSLALCKV